MTCDMCTWKWWIIREWIKLTQKCSWYSYKHISCPCTFQESFHNPEISQVSLILYQWYCIIDTVSKHNKKGPYLCFFQQKKGTWLFLQSLSLLDHQGFSQNPWVQSQVLSALHSFFPENVDEDYIKIAMMKMMIFLILMQSLTLEHSSDFLSNSQMLDSHLQCIGPMLQYSRMQLCNFAILGTCIVAAFHNL